METFKAAVKENLPKIVEELLKTHDPSLLDDWVIRYAASYGFNEIVKILLQDKRVNPGDVDNYAICWASRNGHLEVVKLLLQDERVDPSARNNRAIRWAAENGHLEVVKLLLQDERVDPSDKNNYAIRWASQNGHVEVVKLLLQDERVDPSVKDNLSIRRASANGHLEVVKLLIQHPNVSIEKELEAARENGKEEIIKFLEDEVEKRKSTCLTGEIVTNSNICKGQKIKSSTPVNADYDEAKVLEYHREGKIITLKIELPEYL